VNAAFTALYSLGMRVASSGNAGTYHVEIDGVDRTGTYTMNDTLGWQSWRTLVRNNISLTAGQHVVRLALDSSGANGTVGNYNYLLFMAATPTNPAPAATFSAPADIRLNAATATDGSVDQVTYYANGSVIGGNTASPFGFVWTNVPVGTYSLT